MDISVSEKYCHLQDESKEHKNFVMINNQGARR
jgi:hypothetical protein